MSKIRIPIIEIDQDEHEKNAFLNQSPVMPIQATTPGRCPSCGAPTTCKQPLNCYNMTGTPSEPIKK